MLVQHKGKSLWLELKSTGKKQSKDQILWAWEVVNQGGAEYKVIDDFDKAVEIIERFKGDCK